MKIIGYGNVMHVPYAALQKVLCWQKPLRSDFLVRDQVGLYAALRRAKYHEEGGVWDLVAKIC